MKLRCLSDVEKGGDLFELIELVGVHDGFHPRVMNKISACFRLISYRKRLRVDLT